MIDFSKLKPRDYDCTANGKEAKKGKPTTTIYVNTTSECDANCPFCCFSTKKKKENFNPYFLSHVITEIKQNGIKVNKVAFTGGEPSLEGELLKKAAKTVKENDRSIYVSVNTNGNNPFALPDVDDVDSITISRHRIYKGNENDEYGFINPIKNLKEIVSTYKEKVYMNCVITKGFVDSPTKLIEFLEFYSKLKVRNFGIISLMKVNEFSKENYVDFDSFNFSDFNNIVKTREYNKPGCKCSNFLFRSEQGEISTVYNRNVMKDIVCEDNFLVLNGNELTIGFNGEVIAKE